MSAETYGKPAARITGFLAFALGAGPMIAVLVSLILGKPIELSQVKSSKGNRPSSADVTARLEEAMQELINRKT